MVEQNINPIVELFTHQNLRIVKSQMKIVWIFFKIKIFVNLRRFEKLRKVNFCEKTLAQ